MLTLEHYTNIHHRDTYNALDERKQDHSCLGKCVFITGAGTGIGKAIALVFCRASAHAVFLTVRTRATLEQTQRDILQLKKDCITECYAMDITSETQVSDAFDQAHKRAGRPTDILISNAGYVAYPGKAIDSSFAKLPGSYAVWLSTPAADFLKGRFMYANWDIDGLGEMKEDIVNQNLLTLTLEGMDSTEWLA